MNLLAGFCSPDHPLAGSQAEEVGARAFRIVRRPKAPLEPSDCYALAARWCALGGFVPLSWRHELAVDYILPFGEAANNAICEAINHCAGRAEIAFKLSSVLASNRGANATPGRAYLGALRRQDETHRGFLRALSARAEEQGFALSLTTTTPDGVTGLLRCREPQIAEARQIVTQLAAGVPGADLSVSGALPPFGAGVELVERLGLHRTRRAA